VLISAAASVVLFIIAAPFGHDHHGAGMVMSDIFWPLFLISVPVFVIVAVIALGRALQHRVVSR